MRRASGFLRRYESESLRNPLTSPRRKNKRLVVQLRTTGAGPYPGVSSPCQSAQHPRCRRRDQRWTLRLVRCPVLSLKGAKGTVFPSQPMANPCQVELSLCEKRQSPRPKSGLGKSRLSGQKSSCRSYPARKSEASRCLRAYFRLTNLAELNQVSRPYHSPMPYELFGAFLRPALIFAMPPPHRASRLDKNKRPAHLSSVTGQHYAIPQSPATLPQYADQAKGALHCRLAYTARFAIHKTQMYLGNLEGERPREC